MSARAIRFRGVTVNLSTTPFVQYDYSEADTGNHSRLTKITYPDGYELDYNYATGVDDNISRLTSISDSTGTLESYAYQGEGTVLERNHSQPGLNLTTTLDDFGRINDFNWTNSSGSVSHYAYGYDAAGNRLYKEDLVNSGLSEVYGDFEDSFQGVVAHRVADKVRRPQLGGGGVGSGLLDEPDDDSNDHHQEHDAPRPNIAGQE